MSSRLVRTPAQPVGTPWPSDEWPEGPAPPGVDLDPLLGDAATAAHEVDVLRRHCPDVGRDAAEITVSHLSTALVGTDRSALDDLVERLRPKRATPEAYAAAVNAGTVDDQVGRFRALADAGVQLAMVNLPDLGDASPVERFAPIIERYRSEGQ